MENRPYPRSVKERAVQVFYYQDQELFLVLLFIFVLLFFPLPVLAPSVSIPSVVSIRAVKHPGWLNILK